MIDEPFTMVVLIVLICVGAGVANNWIKTRQNQRTDEGLVEGLDALRADVERLSQRVASLEKIATDPDQQLSREIDRLR